jgi:hypothetical protein
MVENLTQTHELYTESETDRLDNCTYLYDFANSGTVDIMLLYLDGPMTIFFAILALIGGRLAVKFLDRARLNKDLTSGGIFNLYFNLFFQLYTCCVFATLF